MFAVPSLPMSQDRRSILEAVAKGELSPEEAAERLGATEVDPPEASPDDVPTEGLTTVKVVGSFRTAKIVGDPSVKAAIAAGPHTARREGDALVISAEEFVEGEASEFEFSRGKRPRVVLGLGSKPLPLEIRMNPALALHVQLAAGALKIDGVAGPITAQVSAGALKITDFASPLDLEVAGGAVTAVGKLDRGESRIQCAAGAVKVKLTAGSSVKVIGEAGLGRVDLPGGQRGAGIFGGKQEAVVGSGTGRLELEASMGVIKVEAE